jgi:hypothetical protein
MDGILKNALAAAMDALKVNADLVGLHNLDESVFRFLVLSEIKRQNRKATCQAEWHTIDLLAQAGGVNAVIELKFYFSRRTREIDDTRSTRKGGPSAKNETEFQACVDKLVHLNHCGIQRKYIILVYELESGKEATTSARSFAKSYGDLSLGNGIKSVFDIRHGMEDRAVCKLIEVA